MKIHGEKIGMKNSSTNTTEMDENVQKTKVKKSSL